MTNYIDQNDLIQEVTTFLRNQDIMTTTIRSVVTSTHTATLTGSTTSQIDVTNVKNIRSLTIDGVSKSLGSDYTYNLDYTGPSTLITFTSAQTGALSVSYDYGSDKIFPDYPQESLTLNSFPRIAIDLLNINTTPAGLGNENKNEIIFTVVVYSSSLDDLRDYITNIRKEIIDNQLGFYYLGEYVRPLLVGPIIVSDNKHNKIFQQNIDFIAPVKFELN